MTSAVALDADAVAAVRYRTLRSPRELDGRVVRAIEQTLDAHEGAEPAQFAERWYRTADIATYETREAAAAYLGAYAARSILKYAEGLMSLVVSVPMPEEVTVIDWGAGPCPGLAAVATVWATLRDVTRRDLRVDYVAIDRSPAMLEVGQTLARSLAGEFGAGWLSASHGSSPEAGISAWLLMAGNVANEGEGATEVGVVLQDALREISGADQILSIEPATPGPARQMCSLAVALPGYRHIGPCPVDGGACEIWSFREFSKRVYPFETRCLGRWAPAARTAKYSCSVLSREIAERPLDDGERVVISRVGDRALGCRHGRKSWLNVGRDAQPWDVVDEVGRIVGVWP